MKVEQAKQIASNAIEQLRQALEAGHSERLKEHCVSLRRRRASRQQRFRTQKKARGAPSQEFLVTRAAG